MHTRAEITAVLAELGRGDHASEEIVNRLLPMVYDELRVLAQRQRFRWRDQRSPGTTSLVHEAYLRLVDQSRVEWKERGQFFHIASRAMRSILVDNVRRHRRMKRGGDRQQVPMRDDLLVSEKRGDELLELDEALERLRACDERLCQIVECRFFGGLSIDETATALEISPATVKRGWSLARIWLYEELSQSLAE